MTDWQWKVIISLCRTVLELRGNNKQNLMTAEHVETLKEAVRIEDGKQS